MNDTIETPLGFKIRFSHLGRIVTIVLVVGLSLVVVAVTFVALSKLSHAIIVGVIGILFTTTAAVLAFRAETAEESRRKDEVHVALTKGTPTLQYFEKLVNINLENLSAYYITVKSHANKSFLTSLFVGLVGFALIGVGIELAVSNSQHASSVSTLAGLSGVATEFISAVFFYLYNKTVRQMKEYHDSLLAVQNILLSFKLVEDTADKEEKVKMISMMLEYLVGKRAAISPLAGCGKTRFQFAL